VSNAYLSQVELSKRPAPRPDTLKKLAAFYRVPVEELLAQAGYLDPPIIMTEREIDRAFQFVIEDPKYKFGFKLRSQELTTGVKRFVVEMYETATGKKLLPASVTRRGGARSD
jgi:transcriptional regulator with XRE-family HTH domain